MRALLLCLLLAGCAHDDACQREQLAWILAPHDDGATLPECK